MVRRVILIVLDSVGIGALPDAADFGDLGSNTLGHIAESVPGFSLPNLQEMGFGNIDGVNAFGKINSPKGAYGRAIELSLGKDTTTGHWEIGGQVLAQAFPTFPEGFPPFIMDQFHEKIGTNSLGNKTASGTSIIDELGTAHMESGFPIIYTSADSVFQIAMHEDIIPIERQYEICQIARDILTNEFAVGRVIARPFIGSQGSFKRTANRKDFSLDPQGKTILNLVQDAGMKTIGVGKINDIYSGSGITEYSKTKSNAEGIDRTIEYINADSRGLIFTNLVDFDMLYGHRRDPEGYAKCLSEFDSRLPDIIEAMKQNDVLIITADHGNDPTYHGTDHTREYVPVLVSGKFIKADWNMGTLNSFADIGASIATMLGTKPTDYGTSFYSKIVKRQPA